MSSTKATAKVIGLWLDETSEPDRPAWVVSRDIMTAEGKTKDAQTVDEWQWLDRNDDGGAYEQAKEAALELARKEGLCVIQTEDDQPHTCIYAPKAIIICDDIGNSRAEYRLCGSTLKMRQSGEDDILNDNGCAVNDEMDDDDIIEAVRESWTGDAVTISVVKERSIIER